MKKPSTQARILLLDIETSPNIAHVWGLWDQNVGLNQLVSEWHILSFAGKWLGEEKVFYFDQSKVKDIQDDALLLSKVHVLLDQADIVIGHNGRKFDIKKINARFALHGFKPPSPYKIVDTLEIAKRSFAFTSNKLEHLTAVLNTKYRKLTHSKFPGHKLWTGVMGGNKEAWAEMKAYNIQDVMALEELYVTLRAWDRNHPNVDINSDTEAHACPSCGSANVQRRGWAYTNVGQYPRYQCTDCGSWSRGRTTENTRAKRQGLLSK